MLAEYARHKISHAKQVGASAVRQESWSCSDMPRNPHAHNSRALTLSSGAVAVLEGSSGIDLVNGLAQLEQLAARPALNAMPPACSLHSTCTAS